jgi:hypothetical protein
MHYLDDQGYFTPLAQNVSRFFLEYPVSEQLAVRAGHVRELWWDVLEPELIVGAWTGADVGARLYVREFFSPWYSAGVVWLAWTAIALPIAMVIRRIRASRAPDRPWPRPLEWLATTRPSSPDAPVWPVAVFVAASLTLNEFIRWRPPYSHELPYLELVLLAALLLVGLARIGRAYLIFAVVGVLARQAFYFSESSRVSQLALPPLDDFGRLYWGTMILVLLMTMLPGLGRGRVAGTPGAPSA